MAPVHPDSLDTPGYTGIARLLHWLTAALVLVMLPVGIVIAREWGGPLQTVLYNAHKSVGALLLILVLIRLGYRLSHPPPPLSDDIPPLQRLAAQATHWALYALLILQPLLGWAGTSAYPAPVPFFGLFEMPPLVAANRALSERLLGLHGVVGLTMAALAALHIAAALYHHFVRRDRVLLRMLTG